MNQNVASALLMLAGVFVGILLLYLARELACWYLKLTDILNAVRGVEARLEKLEAPMESMRKSLLSIDKTAYVVAELVEKAGEPKEPK